jgi:hypothetical protein
LVGAALFHHHHQSGSSVFARASIWSIAAAAGFLPAQDATRSLLAANAAGHATRLHERCRRCRACASGEVKNVFVDGGRVPPGTLEVRRAAVVNYTPKMSARSQRGWALISSQLTAFRTFTGSSAGTACARYPVAGDRHRQHRQQRCR